MRLGAWFEVSARANLDALAAAFAGVQRHRKVMTGPGFLDTCEAGLIAVHEALFTVHAQSAGHAACRFLAGLLRGQCRLDLGIGVGKAFIGRPPGKFSAGLVAIVIGFDHAACQWSPHVPGRRRIAAQFRMR